MNESAAGVPIGRDFCTGTKYIGTEEALVGSGLIQCAWLANLGGWRRQIARLPDGGFQIVGEGKGNRLTNQHKENGAFSVSRNRDGTFTVFAYHRPEEYRQRAAQAEAQWRAKLEAEQERHRPGPSEKSGVIVHVSRLPKNIGDMMNRFLSCELTAMHLVAVTRTGEVIRTSAGAIPEYIRVNDSF